MSRLSVAAMSALMLSASVTLAEGGDAEATSNIKTNVEIDVGVRVVKRKSGERAKFEEYGELPNGLYLNKINVDIINDDTNDSVHFAAENGLRNNRRATLDVNRAGRYYVSFEWDQTPQLTSTSAQAGFARPAPDRIVFDNETRRITIGTERKTGSVKARLTPTPDWDFRAHYSNQSKTGTRSFSTGSVELVAPVSYRTENFGASAQYTGRYTQDKIWTVRAEYRGSKFANEYESLVWGSGGPGTTHSLAPDNAAHQFLGSYSTALPWFDGRYSGSVAYGLMTQNGRIITDMGPASQLHPSAKIETLTHNHVLSGRLSKSVSANLRYNYRKVDDKNRLTEARLRSAGLARHPDGNPITRAPEHTKKKASAKVKWRVSPKTSIAGQYQWESYDRIQRAVKKTQEHTGKVSLNTRFGDGYKAQLSYLRAERKFDAYRQLETDSRGHQEDLLRKFDIADRDRNKVEARFEIPAGEDEQILLTPTLGWRQDKFGDNLATGGEFGLKNERSWYAGLEVLWDVNEQLSISSSYMREDIQRNTVNRSSRSFFPPFQPPFLWGSTINDVVHTFINSADVTVKDDLTLKLMHVYVLSQSDTDTAQFTGAFRGDPSQFPKTTTDFSRLSATLSYQLGEDLLGLIGFEGDATASLSYVHERNKLVSWQHDDLTPGRSSLDWYDPNYNVHYFGLSLKAKW